MISVNCVCVFPGSGDASESSNPVTVIKKAKLVARDGKLSCPAGIPLVLSHVSLVSEYIPQTRDMAKDDHHAVDPVEKPVSPPGMVLFFFHSFSLFNL